MTDFHQNSIVSTFHNVTDRPIHELESELVSFSEQRPMALILPSLYSELEGNALPQIVNELKNVPYLSQIIIGIDKASEEQYIHALQFFNNLPQQHRVLWHDGPRLTALDKDLAELGLSPLEYGKGRNVWYCIGYALATKKAESIALHDCDILTYDRALLARLLYPVANPQFKYVFCKGYYARVAENKLNGRVARLLMSPLLNSLKTVLGTNLYLEFMDSFRYPLAGEFSFRKDVLREILIPSDWGLEVGVLSEMYRNYANNRLCQADIANVYDHKHQDLSANDASSGLSKMSIDISKAIFRKLATQGHTFSCETFRTIKATYYRHALDLVEVYHNDAIFNGLNFDTHKEEHAIEMFAENIIRAGNEFLEKPMEKPFIPSWNRVISAMPDVLDRLKNAVEKDTDEYTLNNNKPVKQKLNC